MSRVLLVCLLFTTFAARGEYHRDYIDQQPLLTTPANNISIAYRSVGSPELPTVVLIMGLGASHTVWGDAMVQGIEAEGYRVILLDNRDTGSSTRFDEWGQPTIWWQLLKQQVGLEVDAPYTLNDMAADTVALMDELNVSDAHCIGASMGGMIAQEFALRHAQKVRSLVLGCTTPGGPRAIPLEGAGVASAYSTKELSAEERGRALAEAAFTKGYVDAHPEIVTALHCHFHIYTFTILKNDPVL